MTRSCSAFGWSWITNTNINKASVAAGYSNG
jgi:hypothetical protein